MSHGDFQGRERPRHRRSTVIGLLAALAIAAGCGDDGTDGGGGAASATSTGVTTGGTHPQLSDNVDSCEHEACDTDSLAIVDEPVRGGERAVRMLLRDGDVQDTSGTRVEIQSRGFYEHDLEVDDFDGWGIFVPDDWVFDDAQKVVHPWHTGARRALSAWRDQDVDPGAMETTGSSVWATLRRLAVVVGLMLILTGAAGLLLYAAGGSEVAAGRLQVNATGAHVGSFAVPRVTGSLVVVDLAVRDGGPRLDIEVTIAPEGEQALRATHPTTTKEGREALFRAARWRPSKEGPARIDVRVASSARPVRWVDVTISEDPFDHMEIAFMLVMGGMVLFFAGLPRKR